MLTSFFFSPVTYFKNILLLKKYKKKYPPAVVVFDSDYHFLPFLFEKSIFKISINQAAHVVRNYFSFQLKKKISLFPSFIIELVDAFLQLAFSNLIFVPSMVKSKYLFKKVRHLPLIVRKDFLNLPQVIRKKKHAIMLSGSDLEKEKIVRWALDNKIEIISPPENNLHATIQPYPVLLNYNTIYCQGGLSSISEALACGNNLVVSPMNFHCEQYSNAIDVNIIKEDSTISVGLNGASIVAKAIQQNI